MTIHLRSLTSEDVSFLSEALYQAIYIAPVDVPPPRSIIEQPDLSVYINQFGTQSGDKGIIALDDERPVGAVWVRFIRGYGFVDEKTPELSIAVMPEYRDKGIGTQLLKTLFHELKPTTAAVSLSVQMQNPAYRLYQRMGFETVTTHNGSATMLLHLST